MGTDDKRHDHPSYGMVQFNRRSNSRPGYLFGSSVTSHYHTVTLSISTGYALESDLGEQRFRASGEIVEVELSAHQFAEVITTMNVGDGVPCTIRRRDGKRVEDPPAPSSDTERAHDAFEAKMAEFGRQVDALYKDVEAKTAAAKGLSQAARKEILSAVGQVVTETKSNIPFYLRMFTEAAQRISTAAKAEADAWLTSAIHRAGLAHMRSIGPAIPEPTAPELPPVPPTDDGSTG